MSDGLKKNFITFLQKGKELEKPDPLVSYYCRLHALEIGMKASVEQKELLEIMDTLEQVRRLRPWYSGCCSCPPMRGGWCGLCACTIRSRGLAAYDCSRC